MRSYCLAQYLQTDFTNYFTRWQIPMIFYNLNPMKVTFFKNVSLKVQPYA